jgi:hypothetical protein
MKSYELGSHPMVFTPGMLNYCMTGYRTSKGRGRSPFIKIFHEGYGLDRKLVVGLLSGKIPYKVVGESVVFEA